MATAVKKPLAELFSDLSLITDLPRRIGEGWDGLLVRLGLTRVEIYHIKFNNHGQLEDMIKDGLDKWNIQNKQKPVSKRAAAFLEALRAQEMVPLAEELEEEYNFDDPKLVESTTDVMEVSRDTSADISIVYTREASGDIIMNSLDRPKYDRSDLTENGPDINGDFSLRDYQMEIAQDGLKGDNSIIWAGTGSGKTRDAMYIMKNHIDNNPTVNDTPERSQSSQMILPSPASRNMLKHHTDMVSELSEMFSLDSKEWRYICSRVEMIEYVSTRDMGDVKDMFGLCKALKKKGTIDYGKYGQLRDILVKYDVEAGNTIDKYTKRIREEREEVARVSLVMDSRKDDSTEHGNIIYMDDTDMQQVHEEENDDLDLVMEEVEYPAQPVNKSQLDKRRFIQQRTETVVVRKPKFIDTVDDVDHDKYEVAIGRSNEENEMVVQDSITQQSADMIQPSMDKVHQVTFTYKQMGVTHPQVNLIEMKKPDIPPPDIGPISINLRDTDDEEEMEVKDDEDSPFKKAKMMKRCEFWPACVNGNACSNHHPNASCKMFPQCKFGDRCLYIHPNCKFDAKCTRKDCHYTHASKRVTIATTVIQKIVPETIPASGPASIRPSNMSTTSISVSCTFHPNCKNMYCQFAHPRPCRYGMNCMKKGKCAFYHPALPTKDKLKWTAGKTSDDH